jgi:hypothetical protein
VIERRLRQAATEIQGCGTYDYVLVNDDLERASECLNAIVLAERWNRRHGDATPDRVEVQHWMELAESSRTARVRAAIGPILRTFDLSEQGAKTS